MILLTKNQGSRPCGFREDFFMFSQYKPIHILGPRGIIRIFTRRCYIPNIKALGLFVSDKKPFKVFILKI